MWVEIVQIDQTPKFLQSLSDPLKDNKITGYTYMYD